MTSGLPERRLLILDDNIAIARMIAKASEAAGLIARICTDGAQFFLQNEEWSPTDLVIDLMMPDVDGVEVMRRLAEADSRAGIIIISGVGHRILEAARRAATERGLNITGVLSKPFRPDALRQLLDHSAPAARRSPSRKAHQISESELRLALKQRAFRVYYEPQISCASGNIVGFEALVRWHRSEAEIIMPDDFIAVAEAHGLIDDLTDQVLDQSLSWFSRVTPGTGWSLAVNLSPSTLKSIRFVDVLSERCRGSGVAPHQVILEVTESFATDRSITSLDVLTRLRLNGFQVAIDDFGTGHSTLQRLVRMPFSDMKIDKSFTMAAIHSKESRAVIESIIALGHQLGLRVTAEGVDRNETLSYLQDLRCDVAQGFLFSKAMSEDNVTSWAARYAESRP